MSSFSHLVRFESEEDGAVYFADLGPDADGPPSPGAKLSGAKTIEALAQKSEEDIVTVRRLLPPLPRDGLPIYCVGLNYRSHAKEASLDIPACPPLWTKPAAALASPGEEIPVNDFCAKSLLDYEGELVFVTSKDAKNVSVPEAKNYILGYTIGNDLSCRMYQLPRYSAGQFFFAKAFDKFAPIGPTLISPSIFGDGSAFDVVTRVNGDVRQTAEFSKDLIFTPEKILSHMSQGTTIPAGTAVMTGTPAGVGAFRQPKSFLQDGDVVEVEMKKVGVLRNKINFELIENPAERVGMLTRVILFIQWAVISLVTRRHFALKDVGAGQEEALKQETLRDARVIQPERDLISINRSSASQLTLSASISSRPLFQDRTVDKSN